MIYWPKSEWWARVVFGNNENIVLKAILIIILFKINLAGLQNLCLTVCLQMNIYPCHHAEAAMFDQPQDMALLGAEICNTTFPLCF